jgi:hypothetical protein
MFLAVGLLLAAAPDVNMLTLEAGSVPIETPATYGGSWSAYAMSDGTTSTGWCSANDAKGPFAFTFELEQRSQLTELEADNTGVEEASNPGISARNLEVWVSTAGPRDGFTLAARLGLPKSAAATVQLPKETVARWVRIVIKSNWGNPHYTELMELSLRGHPLEPVLRRGVHGEWDLAQGTLLQLADEEGGGGLEGCELQEQPERNVWLLNGDKHGRSVRLEWKEAAGPARGKGTFVLADDGTLRGRWTSESGASGEWLGVRRASEPKTSCYVEAEQLRFLKRLKAEPYAVALRGVSFDGDELKLASDSELTALRQMLLGNKDLKARVLVLGKAADPVADELKRSERRAQKIIQYLTTGGVPASQLDVGFGLLRFGSAVQLEPRVEAQLAR